MEYSQYSVLFFSFSSTVLQLTYRREHSHVSSKREEWMNPITNSPFFTEDSRIHSTTSLVSLFWKSKINEIFSQILFASHLTSPFFRHMLSSHQRSSTWRKKQITRHVQFVPLYVSIVAISSVMWKCHTCQISIVQHLLSTFFSAPRWLWHISRYFTSTLDRFYAHTERARWNIQIRLALETSSLQWLIGEIISHRKFTKIACSKRPHKSIKGSTLESKSTRECITTMHRTHCHISQHEIALSCQREQKKNSHSQGCAWYYIHT